jgi:hypothetical protein
MSIGIVLDSPVLGSVIVTDGCFGCRPPGVGVAGVTDTGAPGTIPVGSVVVFVLGAAGAGWLVKTVLDPTTPDRRVAKIESDSEVTINRTADAVVAFESSVADPRGPNAVCEPIPPNAPARSAAFPLCNRTTTIRNRQTKTCTIVSRVYNI